MGKTKHKKHKKDKSKHCSKQLHHSKRNDDSYKHKIKNKLISDSEKTSPTSSSCRMSCSSIEYDNNKSVPEIVVLEDAKSTYCNKLNSDITVEENISSFSWKDHQFVLNRMFFRDTDIIKRGTSEYDQFWDFLKKYQNFHRKSHEIVNYGNHQWSFPGTWMNLPSSYDHQYKINFLFNDGNIEEIMHRGYLFKDDQDSSLSSNKVLEFQYILLLYLDFLQKQKFAKLCRLREAQANLPIYQYKSKIIDAVNCHQVVLVAGDTGCGKSTQVPQYLLSAGYESIACCQPRRIACISLCKRVAYETMNEFGSEVGYQIRFEKQKTQHTKILFLTEGLLLRQVVSDSLLSNYKVIILDEVHERHLPCDFLLGIVKCLIHQRSDIKVILMSATINIDLFIGYFDNCPVIQVPGRLFPIQIQYIPIHAEEKLSKTNRLNPAPYVRAMQQIDHKYPSSERGDLLVFLSGMSEISSVEEAARLYAQKTNKWIVLPLHSTLSLAEQDKVFDLAPEGVRKCIISTNIAETSVTIDGVRFVVDSGKVKEMSYDTSCRMQRLQEFWISHASAEQRKGRAGRTGPGVCFRLYSESDYDSLMSYSTPEIQRVPLDSLLLQMISMGLPDARKFPFLEPPLLSRIEESLQSLKDQGALTEDESLTPMGQMLSRLPVDVTFGKMLVMGSVFHLTEPVLSLSASMSVQSPFTNRSYRDPNAVSERRQLLSDHGDPFSLLNVYNSWLEIKSESGINSQKWCKRRGLEEQRFYEMTKLRRQFKSLLKDSGLMKFKDEGSNSSERIKRHGELKYLREMKRKFHRLPHRRKFLRLETDIEGIANAGSDIDDEEDEDNRINIHDVEFQMSFGRTQVKELSTSSQVYSHRNLTLLKIILCNGLYPQVALADEHNSYKSDSEQLFHTKGKPFVALHPNSILSLEPDVLHLHEMDIHTVPGFTSRTSLSTKHQLLSYVSLLETTKPYLVNCLRVPAAHTLLLVAHSIDTNQDFTRLVIDGWLELEFPDPDNAQKFVSHALGVRDLWQEVLRRMFQESILTGSKDQEFKPETRRLMKQLLRNIEKFLSIECLHSVRRLLAADKKDLYIGKQEGSSIQLVSLTGSSDSHMPHPIKGGFLVKDYLTYNCLENSDEKQLHFIQKHWKCPTCDQEMIATVLEQVRHQEQCHEKSGYDSSEENQECSNPLKKPYFCILCQKEFTYTSTEILRHKLGHSKHE